MQNTNLLYGHQEQELKSLECVKKWKEILKSLKELDLQKQERTFQQMAILLIKYINERN